MSYDPELVAETNAWHAKDSEDLGAAAYLLNGELVAAVEDAIPAGEAFLWRGALYEARGKGSLRSLPLGLMSSNAWQQLDKACEAPDKIRTEVANMVAFHELDRIV